MSRKRVQKKIQPRKRRDESEESLVTQAEENEKLKDDLDEILDEIDEVLEHNAAEFVKNYVQTGGQ